MLKNKDLLILSELRKNARIALTDISKKHDMPLTTVFNKVRRLEKDIITKATSIIDFSKLGHTLHINFFIKTDKKSKTLFFLKQHPNINSIQKINNEYNYIIEGYFKNMGDLEVFKESLDDGEIEYKLHHVIQTIKFEEFMPL